MSKLEQTDLTAGDIDSLLADFRWLANPPAQPLPERNERLWRQAIDEAWVAERKHAYMIALAATETHPGETMSDLERRQAFRAKMEERLGKPSTAGLYYRRDMPEERYRRLDKAYTEAEARARQKIANEIASVRKRLDLLLVNVKAPLLHLSELAASGNVARAWSNYQAAVHRPKPAIQTAVIQDLERIKAKLERQAGKKSKQRPTAKEVWDRFDVAVYPPKFDEQSLNVGTGLAREVLEKLVKAKGKVVAFTELDDSEDQKANATVASQGLRKAKEKINTVLRKYPVVVANAYREGYYLKVSGPS